MSRVRFKGYSSFIKKTEGKKDNPSGIYQWDTEVLRNVHVFSLDELMSVCKGVRSSLLDAFHWRTTPQGSDYWVERYSGTQPLTQEDKQFLKELYDYHKHNARPYADSSEQPTPF
jgi:hypothetical protein